MKRIVFLIVLFLTFPSCLYKNVMKDEADDIIKARVCHFGGQNYLVMLETVFQATTKEGGRGVTIITGNNELRLSVYNLEDGSLVVRKKMGRQNRDAVEFLGSTEGNLWFFSFKDGIHSLHPETLEINVSQEEIFNQNPDLKDNLAECEWYQLSQFFQFNDVTRKITLTDQKGYRYLMDPESLRAERILGEYIPFDPRTDQNFASHITFPPPVMFLQGDLRKQIVVEQKALNPELSFLNGQFILDRDPSRAIELIEMKLSSTRVQMEEMESKIEALNAINSGQGPPWRSRERDSLQRLENSRNTVKRDGIRLEECRNSLAESGFSHFFQALLSADTTSFFIFHSSGTAKDAQVVISRVELKNKQELRGVWNAEIPGLFFDPSAARETNTFKEIFSKGSPEFRFSYFTLDFNKLIIVWMLHVHCIDTETGEILWQFRV